MRPAAAHRRATIPFPAPGRRSGGWRGRSARPWRQASSAPSPPACDRSCRAASPPPRSDCRRRHGSGRRRSRDRGGCRAAASRTSSRRWSRGCRPGRDIFRIELADPVLAAQRDEIGEAIAALLVESLPVLAGAQHFGGGNAGQPLAGAVPDHDAALRRRSRRSAPPDAAQPHGIGRRESRLSPACCGAVITPPPPRRRGSAEQLADLSAGLRGAEQKALHLGAAERAQHLLLLQRFDALGRPSSCCGRRRCSPPPARSPRSRRSRRCR